MSRVGVLRGSLGGCGGNWSSILPGRMIVKFPLADTSYGRTWRLVSLSFTHGVSPF